METKDSEDRGKPQRKSVSSSWKSNHGPAETRRPKLLPEKREAPEAAEETQDEEPHCRIPIQRNSIFNRAMRHKSKARGTSEQSAGHQADSSEMGKSVNETLTFSLPQGRMPSWRLPTQWRSGAQEASLLLLWKCGQGAALAACVPSLW